MISSQTGRRSTPTKENREGSGRLVTLEPNYLPLRYIKNHYPYKLLEYFEKLHDMTKYTVPPETYQ